MHPNQIMVSAVATPEANAAMARLGFGLRGLVKTCEAHKVLSLRMHL